MLFIVAMLACSGKCPGPQGAGASVKANAVFYQKLEYFGLPHGMIPIGGGHLPKRTDGNGLPMRTIGCIGGYLVTKTDYSPVIFRFAKVTVES